MSQGEPLHRLQLEATLRAMEALIVARVAEDKLPKIKGDYWWKLCVQASWIGQAFRRMWETRKDDSKREGSGGTPY